MEENKIDYKSVPKASKTNPLTAKLSPYLKDPANFEKIQKQILDTFMIGHSHSELIDWSKCKKCTEGMLNRRKILKKLGFKNAQQYYAWRKTHEKIKEMMPLVDWKNKRHIVVDK